MDLKKAIEVASLQLEKSEIVVVTSDNAVYLLKEVSEIEVIKDHAKRNKLECFVVKGGEQIEVEEKPKKKK